MEALILYSLCSAALFYLGSRAMITAWLWSRYPVGLAHFMDCAACSGTWYGFGLGAFGGYYLGMPFMGLPGGHVSTVFLVGLCSMATTPIAAGLMQRGFDALGHTVPVEEVAEAYREVTNEIRAVNQEAPDAGP